MKVGLLRNAPSLICETDAGDGAAGPTRTDDLTLTKRLLYQLSYSGMENDRGARFYQKGHPVLFDAAHR